MNPKLYTSASYNPIAKRIFHNYCLSQLRKVARSLGLAPTDYDLRSNKAGIAVSGEITLHTASIYIQASQPSLSDQDAGLLIRRVKSRQDYYGDRNHFAPLSKLDDPVSFAAQINRFLNPGEDGHAYILPAGWGFTPHNLPTIRRAS